MTALRLIATLLFLGMALWLLNGKAQGVPFDAHALARAYAMHVGASTTLLTCPTWIRDAASAHDLDVACVHDDRSELSIRYALDRLFREISERAEWLSPWEQGDDGFAHRYITYWEAHPRMPAGWGYVLIAPIDERGWSHYVDFYSNLTVLKAP